MTHSPKPQSQSESQSQPQLGPDQRPERQENAPSIRKLLVVSIDGVRPDALAQTPTPTLDKLFRSGTSSLHGQTIMPCATLPAHTALFHGVSPQTHGVITNNHFPTLKREQNFYTLFDRAWALGYATGAYVSWAPLLNIYGDRERLTHAVHHKFYSRVDYVPQGDFWGNYERHVMGFVDFCSHRQPDITHLYLEAPDIWGHCHGWLSEKYLEAITVSDDLLGRILLALADMPAYANLSVLVTTDHGGSDYGHEEDTPANRTTWFAFRGDGIAAGRTIPAFSILDLSPTLASYLKIDPDPLWEGKALSLQD